MKSNKSLKVNYLYFCLVFVFVAGLHVFHVALIEHVTTSQKAFFFFAAASQSAIEVILLAFITLFLEKLSSRLWWVSALLCTLFLIVHAVEFPLMRLMGLSIPYALGMVLEETLENFIEMLKASRISLSVWAALFAGGVATLGLGLIFFRLCQKFSCKRAFAFDARKLIRTAGVAALLLLTTAMGARFASSSSELSRALSWKGAFFPSSQLVCTYSDELPGLPDEDEFQEKLTLLPQLKEKPDLFIFVVESLREDFITEQVAPHFSALRQKGVAPSRAIASGNGTQLSWFSIFFSKHSLAFSQSAPKNWERGSLGLQCLKEMGYKIHLFSSSAINYYQMDQRIFGKEGQLLDTAHCNYPSKERLPHECDRETMGQLMEAVVHEKEGGNCYVVFLESTHFDYSYPDAHRTFLPDLPKINHLKMAFSKKDLEKVKNSYRNSIHYLDSLFGEFQLVMEKMGKWDNAVMALMGDHGEEFYEQGHLFHASNLSREQTHIPLYFKFGNKALPSENVSEMVSHVDIIPTFLHYLTGAQLDVNELLDGESIFKENKSPFAISCRYNGGRNPDEFIIYSQEDNLLVRFQTEEEVHERHRFFSGLQTAFAPLFLRLLFQRTGL